LDLITAGEVFVREVAKVPVVASPPSASGPEEDEAELGDGTYFMFGSGEVIAVQLGEDATVGDAWAVIADMKGLLFPQCTLLVGEQELVDEHALLPRDVIFVREHPGIVRFSLPDGSLDVKCYESEGILEQIYGDFGDRVDLVRCGRILRDDDDFKRLPEAAVVYVCPQSDEEMESL
jgi:hypothetical protein